MKVKERKLSLYPIPHAFPGTRDSSLLQNAWVTRIWKRVREMVKEMTVNPLV